MRKTVWLLSALLAWSAGAAEEMRAWKSKAGSVIEASFVKLEKEVVTLARKDGSTVQARLDALSDEDREYVDELTYVPKEIRVAFQRDQLGLWTPGASGDATARDVVVLNVDNATGGASLPSNRDSSWKIVSVDTLGKRISPRTDAAASPLAAPAGELSTDGKFVFVVYSVKNESRGPFHIPSPRLFDQQSRLFTQAARNAAKSYIPPGVGFAGEDMLQPGFEKQYCAFYEVPEDAVPAAVEVFPSVMMPLMSRFAAQSGVRVERLRGKKILLGAGGGAGEAARAQVVADAPDAEGSKVSLFMKCVRQGASGTSTGSYLRSKTRALTYAVELQLRSKQTENIKVKGFFIGEAKGGREVILDIQETDTTLEPGRMSRVTLTSDEISETKYTSYHYAERLSGAKLKGVVIQAWSGNTLAAGWASLTQWRKYAECQDVLKELGEMRTDSGF